MTTDPQPCQRLVYRGSLTCPPEYCENDAEPGSDYCYGHDEEAQAWDRADEMYARRKEGDW